MVPKEAPETLSIGLEEQEQENTEWPEAAGRIQNIAFDFRCVRHGEPMIKRLYYIASVAAWAAVL